MLESWKALDSAMAIWAVHARYSFLAYQQHCFCDKAYRRIWTGPSQSMTQDDQDDDDDHTQKQPTLTLTLTNINKHHEW
jgi:hypothetical protein